MRNEFIREMRKIIVIGSGGAGKSTFSNALGEALGTEVIHLDEVYWKPGWVKTQKDEWIAIVADLLEGESWIMDGNFGGTRAMRMRASDTIIFLDIPRRICIYRIFKRFVVYRGHSRPDMADGCNERFDPEFVAWVWKYPKRSRRGLLDEIECFPDKRIVILRSRREAASFLQSVRV